MGSPDSFPQGFDILPDGDIVYVRDGGSQGGTRTLVWIDQAGQETEIDMPAMSLLHVSVSSSTTRTRILFSEGGNPENWVYDVGRGLPPQQLTFDNTQSNSPMWIDDGLNYVYTGLNDDGGRSVYRRSADGLGSAEELIHTSQDEWWVLASTIAQDRTTLLGMALVSTEQSSRAIKLPLDNAQGSEALFEVDYSTGSPKLSPDDQWLTYVSNELGRLEIFVTSYPEIEGK